MERVITVSNKELARIEAIQGLENRSIRESEAAEKLGLSTRQIKRLRKAYREEGARGLISKKRGARSNHQLPEKTKRLALKLILEKYPDFGPTLAQEKLVEFHGLKISVGSVRNLMVAKGIWEPKKPPQTPPFRKRTASVPLHRIE